MAKLKLKSNEVVSLNLGLGFLMKLELKDTGVELTWDAVTATNKIKDAVKIIGDMGDKLNRTYFKRNEKTGQFELVSGLEAEFDKANAEIESKEFEFDLPVLQFDKLKDLPGITGQVLLQLQPIIKR